MDGKQVKTIVFVTVMINLIVVAVVGYVMDIRSVPSMVVIPNTGGTVAFNHKRHVDHGSPAVSCDSCHHAIQDEAAGLSYDPPTHHCRACHVYDADPANRCQDAEIHKRCIGSSCASCHNEQNCTFCHQQ